jgi:hypothetical protein
LKLIFFPIKSDYLSIIWPQKTDYIICYFTKKSIIFYSPISASLANFEDFERICKILWVCMKISVQLFRFLWILTYKVLPFAEFASSIVPKLNSLMANFSGNILNNFSTTSKFDLSACFYAQISRFWFLDKMVSFYILVDFEWFLKLLNLQLSILKSAHIDIIHS